MADVAVLGAVRVDGDDPAWVENLAPGAMADPTVGGSGRFGEGCWGGAFQGRRHYGANCLCSMSRSRSGPPIGCGQRPSCRSSVQSGLLGGGLSVRPEHFYEGGPIRWGRENQ